MKLLAEIPQEKYGDVQWVLDWLKENPVIGNENTIPIEYFHCFWRGPISDLHLMSLHSLNKFHPNSKIIFWTPNIIDIEKCESWEKIKNLLKDQIELKILTETDFNECGASSLYSAYKSGTDNMPGRSGENEGLAYISDIVRFVVLYLYGGLWFDMDILFLRNLDSIKLNRFVSQWGDGMWGNAAILKLEKGHDLIGKIIGKYSRPFYPGTSLQLDNDLDLTILPSVLFDILWRSSINADLQFRDFGSFFSVQELALPPELYTYHWHNRWTNNPPPFFKI